MGNGRLWLVLVILVAVVVASAAWALQAFRDAGEDPPTLSYASAAGCWSAEETNADISAILLRLEGNVRPSGKETLSGSLDFVTGGTERFPVHGEFAPWSSEVTLDSSTFYARGELVTRGQRMMLTMVHYDDLYRVKMTMVKDGRGCRAS